jgi:transcriptional regulator with XRE-family HTH domain
MPSALCPDGSRIRELRERSLDRSGEPKTQLRFGLDCGLSERTVQNAESGRPVSRSTAQRIADGLGVPVESLFRAGSDGPRAKTPPGQADYYVPNLVGTWFAECHEHAGVNDRGQPVAAWVHHWRFVLRPDKKGVCGECACITPGFEHGRFDLVGHVDGSRFIHISGIRNGGVDHFFKSLLRYENDGRTTRLAGGYVVFNPEHRAIFVGDIAFTREMPRRAKRRAGRGGTA